MSVLLRRVLDWHRPLVSLAGIMAVASVVIGVLLLIDQRTLDGMPIWAKPLKFTLSFAIYSLSWAWLFSLLAPRALLRRTAWWTGTVLAVSGGLEVAIIAMQAARGVRSHFNTATTLDNAIYQVMAGTIMVLLTANLIGGVMVLRGHRADRAELWTVRLGVVISTVGLVAGGLMLRPTEAQRQGLIKDVIGAHSVGVPDGGPGLPLLGWSTTGGDLRISHFVGMHALQVLPLVTLLLGALARRYLPLRDETVRARLVIIAGTAYTGLFALVTWQALRGQPLIHPDALTLGALALLVAGTVAAAAVVLLRRPPAAVPAPAAPKALLEV